VIQLEPDGFLRVEVSMELANAWDPMEKGFELDSQQTYDFLFRDMRDKGTGLHDCCLQGWQIQDGFLWLFWKPESEPGHAGVNRQLINLNQILNFEVHTNSEEYIQWARENRDS
jgi:hypothetical protein